MDVGAAILGGLIGGAVMIGILYPMIWMMPQQMKMNLLLMLGTMTAPAGVAAYVIGMMMHGMMSVAFGLGHGAILEALDVTSPGAGLALGVLLGLGHALIVGMVFGMMPLVHARMRPATPKLVPALLGPSPAPDEELLDPPGYFATNYPPMTVMGFFMLHIVFGVTVGIVYGALA